MAIPTLTDIGNRIVQGVGTLTGQIRNPFTEQIEELESRLQATNNEDEIVKLNDQLRTLRAASDEWSGYDVAKQDPTAAPEWMQSVHNAARVGGDNLDLVDVGTAFLPVGMLTKGAALAGKNLPKLAAKGVEYAAKNPELWKNAKRLAKSGLAGQLTPELAEAATFAAKNPVAAKAAEFSKFASTHPLAFRTAADATEQGLIEGAHGAATYRPEEGESMGSNALEQGGLAGLIQGGISGLGGRRLRAIESAKKLRNAQMNSPENLKIKEGIENLKKQHVSGLPGYRPVKRAGKNVITQKEMKKILENELDDRSWRNILNRNEDWIDDSNVRYALDDIEKGMSRIFPRDKYFRRIKRKGYWGSQDSPWRENFEDNLPDMADIEITDTDGTVWNPDAYWVSQLIENIYPRPETAEEIKKLADTYKRAPSDMFDGLWDIGYEPLGRDYLDRARKLANTSGDAEDLANRLVARRILNNAGHGGETADALERSVIRANDVQGLAGLKYSTLPDVPGTTRMSRIYSAQTDPLNSFGAARYRAAYNALLDALREGAEGGLDGLYGLGYVDE